MEDNVKTFIETMDSVSETVSQEVVDDPEDLFPLMVELSDAWPFVREILTARQSRAEGRS